MYYPTRENLGGLLAAKLTQYKNNDTIIICLKKSSLLSCIACAAYLHAYVYILQYEEVDDPYNVTRPLGAVTSTGEFVLNPEISQSEYEYICSDFMGMVEQNKNTAFSQVNSEADMNPNFNLAAFNRRNILFFADILNDTFEIAVAFKLLESFVPNSIFGAFGNITTPISDKLKLEADGVTYMDILASTVFDDEHYFDQPDKYTEEQEIAMANNISLYWVK